MKSIKLKLLIFVGMIVGGLCNTFWGLIALIGSLLVSYSRARAEAAGISNMMSANKIGNSFFIFQSPY